MEGPDGTREAGPREGEVRARARGRAKDSPRHQGLNSDMRLREILLYELTRSLVYKGWLIRDGFLGLVEILENLRDDDYT